jgi:hypothetical protein
MSQTIVLTLPLLAEAEAQVSPEEGPAVEEDEEEGKVEEATGHQGQSPHSQTY